jgi:hypothetical protein
MTSPTSTFAIVPLTVTQSTTNPSPVSSPSGFSGAAAVALSGFEVSFSDGKARALQSLSITTTLTNTTGGVNVGWTVEFTDGTSPGVDYQLDLVLFFSLIKDESSNAAWAEAVNVSLTPPSGSFGTGSSQTDLGSSGDSFNLATMFSALSGFTFAFSDTPANHDVEAMGAWVSAVPTYQGDPPLQATVFGGARVEDASSHGGYNGIDAAVIALGAQDPTDLSGLQPTFPVVQPFTVANGAGFSGSWGLPDANYAGYFLLQGFKIQSAGTDEKITSVCVSPQANSKGGSDVTNTAYASGTLTMNGTYTVELTSGSTVFGTGTAQVLYIAAAS